MRVEGKPELLEKREVRWYFERDMARPMGQCS